MFLTSRRLDAERWGNAGVAFAGAAFGLAVGVLPGAFETTGRWLRKRRRRSFLRTPKERD
ncbi:hypothetical protein AB0M02_33145 [Actinoplanes sp. NPDC051861]|uniref:hypothetical protein n=1 Tax=Actinoplanes sp. NPDC051861 TaxID=3155170 RepID=UPI0034250D63